MDDHTDYAAANALIPTAATAVRPSWALVEIFGHRCHYGEVREVEAFGAKLLEVADIDTGKVHRYGGASIFSLTMLTEAEIDAHVETVRQQKERHARYEAAYGERTAKREQRDQAEMQDIDPL